MADVSVSGQVKTYFVTTDATSAGNDGKVHGVVGYNLKLFRKFRRVRKSIVS
jgi:hypothetical protein